MTDLPVRNNSIRLDLEFGASSLRQIKGEVLNYVNDEIDIGTKIIRTALWNRDETWQPLRWFLSWGHSEAFSEWQWLYVQQVKTQGVQVKPVDHILDRIGRPVGECWFVVSELSNPWPCFFAGCSQNSEDSVELVELAISSKEWTFGHHFSEDAANGPNIDRGAVIHRSQ